MDPWTVDRDVEVVGLVGVQLVLAGAASLASAFVVEGALIRLFNRQAR